MELTGEGWLTRFGTPKGIIWMGIRRPLQPRWILHSLGGISVHGGVSQAFEPGQSGPELSALPTSPPRPTLINSRLQNYSTTLDNLCQKRIPNAVL